MRFKIGDKVEVMNNKEVPVSWRPAEVLSASAHTYRLQYDHYPGTARDQLVEMVPRKFVRPCPSLVQGVGSFIAGDIVEVFYQYSWKIAVILNILGGRKASKKSKVHLKVAAFKNKYLVRLLGCSQELVVDRLSIRMRQTWHDGKWTPIGKGLNAGDDEVASKPSASICCQMMKFQVPQLNARAKIRPKKDCTDIQADAALIESPVISARSLKRMSPYGSSIVEAQNGHVQKLRATEKEGWKQRVVADPVLEKGYSWRHASFASNGLKMMPGFAAFLLALNFGRFSRLLPKRCYCLWPLPGIKQFKLQYFSFFQELLDMFAFYWRNLYVKVTQLVVRCSFFFGNISSNFMLNLLFLQICVLVNAENVLCDVCAFYANHEKPELHTHYRPSCIQIHLFSLHLP